MTESIVFNTHKIVAPQCLEVIEVLREALLI